MVEIIRYMWRTMKPYFIRHRFLPFIFCLYMPMTVFTFIPYDIQSEEWRAIQWFCLCLSTCFLLYQLLTSFKDIYKLGRDYGKDFTAMFDLVVFLILTVNTFTAYTMIVDRDFYQLKREVSPAATTFTIIMMTVLNM